MAFSIIPLSYITTWGSEATESDQSDAGKDSRSPFQSVARWHVFDEQPGGMVILACNTRCWQDSVGIPEYCRPLFCSLVAFYDMSWRIIQRTWYNCIKALSNYNVQYSY